MKDAAAIASSIAAVNHMQWRGRVNVGCMQQPQQAVHRRIQRAHFDPADTTDGNAHKVEGATAEGGVLDECAVARRREPRGKHAHAAAAGAALVLREPGCTENAGSHAFLV